MRCSTHCPGDSGGLLAVAAVAAVAVALVVAFIAAHVVVLAIGSGVVLAVVAASQWVLRRFFTLVYVRPAPGQGELSRARARAAVTVPAFRELAGRQPAAISQRRPAVIEGIVLQAEARQVHRELEWGEGRGTRQ